MKYIHILIAALLGAAFTACDSIKEDERYIDLPKVEAQRVVLLEDYTGQKCVNCPGGHEIIESLEKQFPDNFIAVSIHGGGDNWSISDQRGGLRCDDGQAYSEAANIYSYPTAVVNRNSGLLDKSSTWASAVRAEVEKPSAIELDLQGSYDAATNTVSIAATALPHETIGGCYLQVWIVENGIVARQSMPDGSTNRDYVHNNVLRAAVNGLNGESIDIHANTPAQKEYSISVKEIWNPANLSVVAFVYNNSGVLQASRTKIE